MALLVNQRLAEDLIVEVPESSESGTDDSSNQSNEAEPQTIQEYRQLIQSPPVVLVQRLPAIETPELLVNKPEAYNQWTTCPICSVKVLELGSNFRNHIKSHVSQEVKESLNHIRTLKNYPPPFRIPSVPSVRRNSQAHQQSVVTSRNSIVRAQRSITRREHSLQLDIPAPANPIPMTLTWSLMTFTILSNHQMTNYGSVNYAKSSFASVLVFCATINRKLIEN